MHRKRVLFSLILVAILTVLVSAVALAKGHVPAGNIQVVHRGIVKEVPEQARSGHVGHGDIHLPACDFTPGNSFTTGTDVSGLGLVADAFGFWDAVASGFAPRTNGTSAACGIGTF